MLFYYVPPQNLYGFPINGSGQKQDGCLFGSHTALWPQGFGSQGFFFSTHPRIVFGLSMYPGKHVHFANPLSNNVHCVLGPQGDGVHGLDGKRQGVMGGSPSYSDRQKHTAEPCTTLHPEYGPHGLGEHSSPSGTKINMIFIVNIIQILMINKHLFIYLLFFTYCNF